MQRFRIPPTPSGFLHIGNAFNFILTALLAGQAKASLRLRIDDADAVRARPECIEDIFQTLHWLGIRWDSGPRDAGDHALHFSQCLRTARYAELIRALIATGEVFACDCSRKKILARSTDGQYPGTCCGKKLPLDAPDAALRLRTPENAAVAFNDGILGLISLRPHDLARDPIIRRRDGLAAYHIASLADDLDFGITHIVRGEDLLGSTVAQLFIAQRIGASVFERTRFFHHPLLKDDAGEKLSKSAGSRPLRRLVERQILADDVYRQFSAWIGWSHVAETFDHAAEIFARQGLGALAQFGGR